jgi:apolipoprotein D and lipocalin family protein
MSLKRLVLLLAVFLSACTGMPESVAPAQDFDVNRYLGQWYEIARLDHSFERGLEQISAEYSLRDDGGIKVINRGFSLKENQWREAEGKAYFVDKPNEGYLKVSFFGPFYGSYVIFALDQQNYEYAFVSGPNTSYLWLLSRTPTVEPELLAEFIDKASKLGFDTDKLIYVRHETD